MRFLDDCPPVDHPLYPRYNKHSQRHGIFREVRGHRFGTFLYDRNRAEFAKMWDELMANPSRWPQVKEGR